MARREGTALVIGPGPVTPGQGPYLQYSAARGCGYLRRLGMRVLVLEDNPATLMDLGGGEMDLYMEPPAPEVVERIIERNGAVSVWYGLGGRRGWLLAIKLAGEDWYERLGLQTPGLEDRTLWLCGDRSLLRETLEAGGLANPAFHAVGNAREGQEAAERIGFPLVVRPHFSSGGWGSGVAYNMEEYPVLLEEAMRESITGEVLVEEALAGWHKYIALVLRDGRGDSCVPGIFEQLEPLPRHDEDAVLVFPPQRLGSDGTYALREMAREVVEALDLLGLVEMKLAAPPGWEALYVIDVNPWPWRTMPLLEASLGTDLLRVHLDLVTGEDLPRSCVDLESWDPEAVTIAVPRVPSGMEGDGEGYRALGCRSMGRRLLRGRDACEAAAMALQMLAPAVEGEPGGETREALGVLVRRGGGKAKRQVDRVPVADREGVFPWCLARTAEGYLSHAVMLLGGDNGGPSGGYEANANCYQALKAWRESGERAAVYATDAGFAMLAAGEADAVFLGPLEPEEVFRAVSGAGMRRLVAHFGGREALRCAGYLARGELEVWGWEGGEVAGGIKQALERVRSAGLPVVGYSLSRGLEEGLEILRGSDFPVSAAVERKQGGTVERLVYGREDGVALLREYPDDEVLWRPLREGTQEIQVEAVGGERDEHLLLLWEQVDEVGICSCDGLAVYPPCYLTTEQGREALGLARKAVAALGWKGNLSMRVLLDGGEVCLWDVSPGPSENMPFLQRASGQPLAAYGMLSLAGRNWEARPVDVAYSAVRAPFIPLGTIGTSDILPSPQRRSTGAVMGVARDPGMALAKALWSHGLRPRLEGKALLSVANREKRRTPMLARELKEAGYALMATRGTAHALAAAGMEVETVNKLREGRPNILDFIRNGQVDLVVNIPRGKHPHSDGFYIRSASARHGIPCITNMEVALGLARGMHGADPRAWEVRPLEEYGRSRHGVRGG